MLFGYARVSTVDQNLDRQLDELWDAGAEVVYSEKETGTWIGRPELNKLLGQLRAGDVVLITELSRLGRSLKDLLTIVEQISKKGAHIKSLKDSWLDTQTPHGKLIFYVMAALAEFERDMISERTKSALKAAAARGRKGGRPRHPAEKTELALKMLANGFSYEEIKQATGIPRATVQRYAKEKQEGGLKKESGESNDR